MTTPQTPAGVPGKVIGSANLRNDFTVNATKVGTLKDGQSVVVTACSVDPAGAEFARRYRVQSGGQTYWTSAAAVAVESARLRRALPFLNMTGSAGSYLSAVGMRIPEPVTLEDAEVAIRTLWDIDVTGVNSRAAMVQMVDLVQKLESYAVVVETEDGGLWSPGDLGMLLAAAQQIAAGTANLFEPIFGFRDEPLAFRALYAPLRIVRSGKDNVNPRGDAVWFAKNSNGYEIVFGNKVFRPGNWTTKVNPGLFYTATDLIAHEIGHVINWRYPRNPATGGALNTSPASYYFSHYATAPYTTAAGQRVTFGSYNAGYAMAARSSDGPNELVTDAITCLNLDRFTQTPQGAARKEALINLMKLIITYRVQRHGGLDAIRADIQAKAASVDPALPQKMAPALDWLAASGLDDALAELNAKLAG
jgi:hypothetical protein